MDESERDSLVCAHLVATIEFERDGRHVEQMIPFTLQLELPGSTADAVIGRMQWDVVDLLAPYVRDRIEVERSDGTLIIRDREGDALVDIPVPERLIASRALSPMFDTAGEDSVSFQITLVEAA